MKLSRFEIRNFKNLANVTFDWEGILLLIGENNTGKSSVLLALEWFLSGSQIKNQKLFRNSQCTLDHCIELTAHFTNLTEAEQGAIAVRGRLYDNKWILKKRLKKVKNGRSCILVIIKSNLLNNGLKIKDHGMAGPTYTSPLLRR